MIWNILYNKCKSERNLHPLLTEFKVHTVSYRPRLSTWVYGPWAKQVLMGSDQSSRKPGKMLGVALWWTSLPCRETRKKHLLSGQPGLNTDLRTFDLTWVCMSKYEHLSSLLCWANWALNSATSLMARLM